jgi:hypothetical protein
VFRRVGQTITLCRLPCRFTCLPAGDFRTGPQKRPLVQPNVCQRYIAREFLDALTIRCRDVFGKTGAWSLDVSAQDPNMVRFRYPAAGARRPPYVVPQVVLELGTHAEFVPRDRFTIRSFAAEEFPELVADGEVGVVALLAKRTFWEKATILHAEYHRPPEKPLPDRYSRHYYDVAMLAEGPVRAEALADKPLLAQVVRHKKTFYPSAWAHYNLAHPGSLRLLPAKKRLTELERDYRNMGVTIFVAPRRSKKS